MSAVEIQRRTAYSISEILKNFDTYADATIGRNDAVRQLIAQSKATRNGQPRAYSSALSKFEFDHGGRGARIVFRRAGIHDQIVGRKALDEILLARVSDEQIQRGSLRLRLRFRVGANDVIVPVDFRLPNKGSNKQDVHGLVFAMDSAMYQVRDPKVTNDAKVKFRRAFLERVARWATLTVVALTKYWVHAGPCSFELAGVPRETAEAHPDESTAYSFRGRNPWLVFLIWCQYMHGRVVSCNRNPDWPMNRVPIQLLFDRDQLNIPGSPQAIILTAIKAVLGDQIFAGDGLQRRDHGEFTRFHHDNSYKLLSLNLRNRAQLFPIPSILFLKMLACYFYNNNDEQYTYYVAGAFYLIGVYGSPEFALYHGIWRLLLQFIHDAGIYKPLVTRVRRGNEEVKYFPRDTFSKAGPARLFPLGTIEPFLGTRHLSSLLAPGASMDRCPFYSLDQDVPPLERRAQHGLRWPGNRDIERQQQRYRAIPSLLGGFGRYRAIA
ncbi:Oidioi.mRNA.OKI2018_I69.YSR.g17078.t1.cds [Oikopleura dioica]|uniref:Oidioi.mRNA.OKI2018_I69.YSR.g17068.t1.cds n=1 Tax=Oikopleura dioica TaxID=34765 RepID=A0ABN7SIL2_OIKDI|nr:Oidioi.mRNA.OKI2018_I69.YSR.g17068.t1.cds [Oikopleura dioica]CAG5101427.1 Oidioi.mRNA.OKI2018_I69.YSR.g17078.t1.cds [Oikopleura dioica]